MRLDQAHSAMCVSKTNPKLGVGRLIYFLFFPMVGIEDPQDTSSMENLPTGFWEAHSQVEAHEAWLSKER